MYVVMNLKWPSIWIHPVWKIINKPATTELCKIYAKKI